MKQKRFLLTDIRLEAASPTQTNPLGRQLSKSAKNGLPGRAWGKMIRAYEKDGKRFLEFFIPLGKEFAQKGYNLTRLPSVSAGYSNEILQKRAK